MTFLTRAPLRLSGISFSQYSSPLVYNRLGHLRFWSNETVKETAGEKDETPETVGAKVSDSPPQEEITVESLQQQMKEMTAEWETSKNELRHQLLECLADQENTRKIAVEDVASAKKYSVAGFAKDLLEVADNLSRALQTVTPEELERDEKLKVRNGWVTSTSGAGA